MERSGKKEAIEDALREQGYVCLSKIKWESSPTADIDIHDENNNIVFSGQSRFMGNSIVEITNKEKKIIGCFYSNGGLNPNWADCTMLQIAKQQINDNNVLIQILSSEKTIYQTQYQEQKQNSKNYSDNIDINNHNPQKKF